MELTTQESKALKQQRLRNNREKVAEVSAVQNAIAAQGYETFLARHSGGHGFRNGIFHDCEANRLLLETWIQQAGLSVNDRSLEAAFHALQQCLAKPPETQYQRQTNTQESRGPMKQLRSFAPPDLVLPYTRETVLDWSKDRLKKEMARGERVVKALNKILQGN